MAIIHERRDLSDALLSDDRIDRRHHQAADT